MRIYAYPRLDELGFHLPPLLVWRLAVERRILQKIKPLQPQRILEVACGTGHFTRKLRGSFPWAEIFAVDISEKMIRYASDRVAGVKFKVADFWTLEGKYDLIVVIGLFPYVKDIRRGIEKIVSLLCTHGKAYVTVAGPNLYTYLHRVWSRLVNRTPTYTHKPCTRVEVIEPTTGTYLMEIQAIP